jgi:hypothetical protein
MDRALAGLIVTGIIGGVSAGMFALDWLFEQMVSLTLRCCRRVRAARASR